MSLASFDIYRQLADSCHQSKLGCHQQFIDDSSQAVINKSSMTTSRLKTCYLFFEMKHYINIFWCLFCNFLQSGLLCSRNASIETNFDLAKLTISLANSRIN